MPSLPFTEDRDATSFVNGEDEVTVSAMGSQNHLRLFGARLDTRGNSTVQRRESEAAQKRSSLRMMAVMNGSKRTASSKLDSMRVDDGRNVTVPDRAADWRARLRFWQLPLHV